MAYSPLGKGFLTGQVTADTEYAEGDFRNTVPRLAKENRAANLAFVDLVRSVAAEADATPAQVALAWLLSRSGDVVPIPGTTKAHRVDENVGAAELTLTDEQLRRLTEGSAGIEAAGHRYSAAAERMVDR